MVSQNILNLIDAAMVGHLGSAALGAVGISSYLNFLFVAIFMGLAIGVQVMVARRLGEGNEDQAAVPLNGSLLMILLLAVPVAIALYFAAPLIINMLLEEQAVIDEAEIYLQMRVIGIWAIAMNFTFRGFWSGIKLTKYYMYVLIGMHMLNIFLNYALIYGNFGFPEMGVQGAGLGTTLSMTAGTLTHFTLCLFKARKFGFADRLPSLESIKAIVRLSIPNSIQQIFFAAGFSMLFWIISMLGADALAAANAIMNISMLAFLPCIAFGMSASTLVSEALGRENPEDAYRWSWDVAQIAMIFMLVLSVIFFLFGNQILAIFLVEPAALEIALMPLLIVAIGLPFEGLGMVMMHGLIGAGATKSVMKVSMGMQWLIFIPIAWFLGPVLGFSLSAIWLAQVSYRLTQGLIFTAMWRKREWQAIRV
jgi:putative MATE family efflux protein